MPSPWPLVQVFHLLHQIVTKLSGHYGEPENVRTRLKDRIKNTGKSGNIKPELNQSFIFKLSPVCNQHKTKFLQTFKDFINSSVNFFYLHKFTIRFQKLRIIFMNIFQLPILEKKYRTLTYQNSRMDYNERLLNKIDASFQ